MYINSEQFLYTTCSPHVLQKEELLTNIYLFYGHGIQTPNEAFFHWNPELLGLIRQIGQLILWVFWVFLANPSAPILAHCTESLVHFNHYFYKKEISLYIQIPFFFFLELRFGRSVSVVHDFGHISYNFIKLNQITIH